MDEYRKYNFTLTEETLLPTIKAAAAGGYTAFVVINGMNYSIELKEEQE